MAGTAVDSIKKWLPRLADALFPRRCPFCGALLGADALQGTVCPACVPEEMRLQHIPPRLPEGEHSFYAMSQAAAAYYYADTVRSAILRCKRGGSPWRARELADRLLPLEQPVVHRPHGGEKMVFAVLGANGLSTLALLALALKQSRPYAPDAQTAAFAHLNRIAAWAARWLPMGTAWLLVLGGVLFCASLARSAAHAAHYTVWRTESHLGSRGGFVRRYEMRLALEHLSYADLRRSPATWALGCCPVFVTAGSCQPEIPLLVWREDGPFLQELLPGFALPPKAPVDTAGRSIPAFFLPAGIPCGLCLLLTAVSRYTLPALTVPLLVVTAVFAALLVSAAVGYRRESIWLQNGRLTLRWQHGFHLHDICVLCPVPALTALQSPWAAAVHRTNLTLTFPGRVKCRVRSVKCSELPFLLF